LWLEIFAQFVATIKATGQSSMEILEDSWIKRAECGRNFPCCTYGEEYQYNVKEMLRHGKVGIYRGFDHFFELEQKRLTLHSQCPNDTPSTCLELGPCWDGSVRASNWPDCECPDFDHDKYKCPEHKCNTGTHMFNEEIC
jgi:hypothetical protein